MADYFDKSPREGGDRIDRLRRGIYSRNTPDVIDSGRSQIKKEEGTIQSEWKPSEAGKFDVLSSRFAHTAAKSGGFAKKLLLMSSILFVVSIIVAAFVFLGGMNLISSKNVDIRVVGPVAVGGGQEVSFEIEVVNENKTDLQGAKLTIEYPKGLRSIDDVNKELTSQSFILGNIDSGETARQKIDAYIFGKKSEIKTFHITVEYRVKNSSALFYKEKVHELTIDSSPVIVNSIYPKEVNANQEISFEVEVASNSGENLSNFLLNIEYPFGFTFKSGLPSPSYDNNTWKMSLKSGEKRRIAVRGTIAGQDNEERVFKVNAGTANPDDERKVGVLFVSSNESILVRKPFIGVDLSLSGTSGTNVVSGTGEVGASLTLMNNLPERVFNTAVEVSFAGSAFSENSVTAGSGGFFRSVDDTILWDRRSIDTLGDFPPGDDISLSFRFTPLGYESISGVSSPDIKIRVKVTGERILASGAVENIESTEERTIKLATNLLLAPKIVRSSRTIGSDSINNRGPVPPKVDTETTYTVVWALSNSFNTANSIEMRAVLPQYVKWNALYAPKTDDVMYIPSSGEVVWRVNQVPAGTGYKTAPREVAFQISFVPSVSQVGTIPELVGPISIRATDRVTGGQVSGTAPALSTNFSSDSSFKQGDDKVVQ